MSPSRRPATSFLARLEPHTLPRFGAAGSLSAAMTLFRRRRPTR